MGVFSGEKAQITKRATTLKEFIHTDAAKAEITIHLCNKGSSNSEKKSYCPDKYGDTIIFHRLIRREGNSTFTISGSADTNFEKTGSKLIGTFEFSRHFFVKLFLRKFT